MANYLTLYTARFGGNQVDRAAVAVGGFGEPMRWYRSGKLIPRAFDEDAVLPALAVRPAPPATTGRAKDR